MKQLTTISLATLFMSCILLACNDTSTDRVENDTTVTSTTLREGVGQTDPDFATVQTDTMTTEGKEFFSEADNLLSLNIHLSKAAITQSQDTEVKNLAKTIADQSTELYNKLEKIAEDKGKSLMPEISTSMQETIDVLTGTAQPEFDHLYLRQMKANAETNRQWFDKQQKSINDRQLQQFSATAIPIMVQHFDAANSLLSKK